MVLYNKNLKNILILLYIFICKYNIMKKLHSLVVKLQFLLLKILAPALLLANFFLLIN